MINLFVWSGPRNISTALMRSFENRKDTKVYDEPFYAYYLKKTNLNHPMKDQIINHYHTNEDEIIKLITTDDEKYEIFYQIVIIILFKIYIFFYFIFFYFLSN